MVLDIYKIQYDIFSELYVDTLMIILPCHCLDTTTE